MHEPTYRQALSHAWHIVWHNKILWVFGLLALSLGQFGLTDFLGKLWMIGEKTFTWQGLSKLHLPNTETGLALVWVGAIVAALAILFLVISTISQGALITSSALSLQNHQPNLNKAWHRGTRHFWPVLIINILRSFLATTVLIIAGYAWTLLVFKPSWGLGGSVLMVVTMALAIFVGLSITSWSVYSLCYCVLDGKGLLSALKKGWQLFHQHLLVSLELNGILLLALVVLIALFYGLSFISLVPSLLIWMVAGVAGNMQLVSIGFLLWFAIIMILIAVAGAIFNAFTVSTWTYLFLKMHHEGISSRVVHYFKRAFAR